MPMPRSNLFNVCVLKPLNCRRGTRHAITIASVLAQPSGPATRGLGDVGREDVSTARLVKGGHPWLQAEFLRTWNIEQSILISRLWSIMLLEIICPPAIPMNNYLVHWRDCFDMIYHSLFRAVVICWSRRSLFELSFEEILGVETGHSKQWSFVGLVHAGILSCWGLHVGLHSKLLLFLWMLFLSDVVALMSVQLLWK